MIKKNLIFIINIFIFLNSLLIVNAEAQNFSLAQSYKWLNNTLGEKNFDPTNPEIGYDGLSLSILALGTGNYNQQFAIDRLKNLQSDDGSWNGNIIDTSFAALALYKTGNDVTKSAKWLLGKQIQAATSGNWLVQIKTTNSGKCTVSLNENEGVEFEVDSNGVNCNINGVNTWIDLQTCANFNIGMNDTLSVNCNNLGPADISLIYKQDNNYYILDSKPNTRFATFSIENTYFGNYDSTLYASWALTTIGKTSQLYTLPYLKANLRDNNNMDRALMLLITNSNNYAEYLQETQNNFTGSWDDSIYDTAFISYSLKKQGKSTGPSNLGIEWLKGEQNDREGTLKYGSWNGEVRETAMAILDIAGDFSRSRTNKTISTSTCGNKIVEGSEECDAAYLSNSSKSGDDTNCNKNEKCSNCRCKEITKQCEISDDCPIKAIYSCINNECVIKTGYCDEDNPCSNGESCDAATRKCTSIEPECTSDDGCGSGKECRDGTCVDIEGFCASNDDCEKGYNCNNKISRCEKNKFPLWIIAIVLILIIGLLALFVKKKGGLKLKLKKEPPNHMTKQIYGVQQPKPMQQPRQIQSVPRNYMDDRLEKELDESIKKAKDILGKK